MKDQVMIKGTKSGIVLVLDSEADFEDLKTKVGDKFKESSDFLGKSDKALSFQGRKLDDDQKEEIIQVIHNNCDLKIVCVTEDYDELEKLFKKSLEEATESKEEDSAQKSENPEEQDFYSYTSTGQFFKGNLRSGQVLEAETSIIVLGDVKAGSKVVSKGNIIVLGSVKGNVYAGAGGNANAFVVALDMDPVQVRIADTIARAPDQRKLSKKKETRIAICQDGNIYIEPLDKDIMKEIRI